MGFWFNASLVGFLLILVPYFLSLEHDRLDRWLGDRSHLIGDALGMFSGWGFFIFWIGVWASPQSRFQWGYPMFSFCGYTFTALNNRSFLIFFGSCFLAWAQGGIRSWSQGH